MKLVKIEEELYLNSDFIGSVEADGEGSTDIMMKNGEVFSLRVPIKKYSILFAVSRSTPLNAEEQKLIGKIIIIVSSLVTTMME